MFEALLNQKLNQDKAKTQRNSKDKYFEVLEVLPEATSSLEASCIMGRPTSLTESPIKSQDDLPVALCVESVKSASKASPV